jgi:hypothetical protein
MNAPAKHSPAHITILLADMLPPMRFAPPVATPALDAVLARAGASVRTRASMTLEAAVLESFRSDSNAYAAMTAAADLGDASRGKTWLRADPVHFAVSRDNVQLFDSHVIQPTQEEMVQIAAAINKHFAQDGLCVVFPDAARGYIEVAADNVPNTTALWDMPGANVFDNLPRVKTDEAHNAKTNWRAITNEMQMLLHDHPVNVAREKRGVLPINGLWFWGGGSAWSIQKRYDTLIGSLVLARGLAALSGCDVVALGERFDAGALAGSTLIVLHQATRELRAQAPDAWAREVANIDTNFIAPALAAFDDGKVASLEFIIANDAVTLEVDCARDNAFRALLRRFAKPKSLADFARHS